MCFSRLIELAEIILRIKLSTNCLFFWVFNLCFVVVVVVVKNLMTGSLAVWSLSSELT